MYKPQDPYPFVDKVGEEDMWIRAQDGFTLNTHFLNISFGAYKEAVGTDTSGKSTSWIFWASRGFLSSREGPFLSVLDSSHGFCTHKTKYTPFRSGSWKWASDILCNFLSPQMCNSVYINRVYVCVSVGRLFLEKLKGTCLLFLASYFQPSSAFLLLPSDSITSVVKGTVA